MLGEETSGCEGEEFCHVISLVFVTRSFWNIVVVTACDEEQRTIYEHQLKLKQSRNELPCGVR